MKRSRRVVLTLMGSAAVGAVSMGLVPRAGLRPGQRGRSARSGRQALLPPDLSAVSAARSTASHVTGTAMAVTRSRRSRTATGWRYHAQLLHAAHRLPRARRLARAPPRAPDSIFTPSTANAIGTNGPTTPSRWTRSSAGSRRRPARSTRCASNWSAMPSTTKNICAG